MKRTLLIIVTIAVFLLLPGCGGGGGSDNYLAFLEGEWEQPEDEKAIECILHPGEMHEWDISAKFDGENKLVSSVVTHTAGNVTSELCLTTEYRDRTWEGKGHELKLTLNPVPGYILHTMFKLEVNTDNDDTQGLVMTVNPDGNGIGDIVEAELVGIEYGDGPEYGPNQSQGAKVRLKLKRVAL